MTSSSSGPQPATALAAPRTLRSLAWVVWGAVAVMLAACHFLVPPSHPVAEAVFYCLVSGGTAVAMAVGIRLHRPAARTVWWLLAGGQVMYVGGDVAYFVATAGGSTNYPVLANVLYLSQYVFVAAALVLLGRRRSPQRNTAALIDTAILAVAAAVLWWVFLIHPAVAAPGFSALDRVAATIYPVMDLCVLTVAIRMLLGGGARQRSYLLLLTFLALTLFADTAYGLLTLHGVYETGGWSDAVYLTSYLALGAAALHRSMRQVADPVEDRSGATLYRVVLLAVATLVAPVVLIVQNLRQVATSDLVVVTASAVLFLLVLTRMAGLVSAQRRIAMTDALTGVYTRRFLSEALRVESGRAARHGDLLAMLLVDVDHFKRINDTYGHPAGDQVLKEVAHRLREACRGTDVVARFGGEEFAVLVTGEAPDGLAALAERLRKRIAGAPVLVDGHTAIAVTVSVGAAALPGEASTEQLLVAADDALYAAKRGGRNRVVMSDPERAAAYAPTGSDSADIDRQIQRWTVMVGEALRCRADGPDVPATMVAGVCAAWALMRIGRPGYPVLSAEQARAELQRCRGVQLHPCAVDEFLALEAAGVVGTPESTAAPLLAATMVG
ncbi:GGDEF domain-containing protein [Actinoplanes sp. NEAU-A12]|uniref:GGDEF domain-containing protein n=1 Tax=Actinoplanes sandaracinus TaxID=3045177 RepID=A0ABT6X155_9ACTN|nr:GGDEF domain-containing protein [Actinoplanes sandaracinus]MDI6105708.1 GGDEF domain-containing protein [Actinoplanes sandaracinus]